MSPFCIGCPSLVPSPSFLALECAGSKKVGPGIHCLRMRYKNLMNLIINSSRDANLRYTHEHSIVLFLLCRVGSGLYSVLVDSKQRRFLKKHYN